MEMFLWFILIVTLLATCVIFYSQNRLKIPGPKALPLLGNLHQLNKAKLHVQLLEWAKHYGPVYRIYLGGKPVVIVTGSKEVHEVLVVKGKDFSGRAKSYIDTKIAHGGNFFLYSDPTELWRIRKKILLSTFKGYGSGLKKIEELTIRFTNHFINVMLTNDNGNGIYIKEHIEDLTYNIINTISVRESLHTKENVNKIKGVVNDLNSLGQRSMGIEGFLLNTFPLLRFVMPTIPTGFDKLCDDLLSIFMKLKNEELDILKKDSLSQRDVSEKILLSRLIFYQMAENEVELDDESLCWLMFNTYAAGIISTTTSFSFLFTILAEHESKQATIQNEIDDVAQSGCIRLEDKDKMPYTHATLLEMLRFTSIVPVLIPHRSTTDTSIDGHHIPKDTEIWINAWGLHHDDALWDQPFKFMPERFLDASGAVVPADHPHRRNLVAFGAGLRVCAGESFAMSRMFLILAMVLQKFTVMPFSPEDEQPTCDTRDIDIGIVLEPPHCKLKLQARN